jgi:hypothetical protein
VKIAHTNLSPGVLVEACKRVGLSPGDQVVILPAETYRALTKSFCETASRLEAEASYHEQEGRPSIAAQIRSWCAEADAAIALLREADTGEGT